MHSIFDEFFDDFSLFGKPQVVYNTSGLRDLMPTCWKETDEGYQCMAKTLGINSEDVKVSVENYGIKLYGESEIKGEKFNTTIKIPISTTVLNQIKEINTSTINGVTFISLVLDSNMKKIKINGK